ncbi:unnamed protein product [Caenorhabditis angaria]|uniref:Biopterin-dependent aromatic amino acid hydroxylase family profile domain-containing protein n=1 Tax=Caenorhabditis angaria TaxID=860376 RepID=A0A9P1IB17_9PELO|nr:unnamed protein product [Caenorhabditis angaria]
MFSVSEVTSSLAKLAAAIEIASALPLTMASTNPANPMQESKPKNPRRYSLVHQASCETQHRIGVKRQNTIQQRKALNDEMRGQKILQQLNDEGVEIIWSANEGAITFSAIMSSTSPLPVFTADIVNSFQSSNVEIIHLESRTGRKKIGFDVLADCVATKQQLIEAANSLTKRHSALTKISIYKKKAEEEEEELWFPRHISDLDKCSLCITKYEPTTDPRHPGFGDQEYIARRKFLNDQALEYKHGDEIGYVKYTQEEHDTWKAVYEKLGDLHESHTCAVYRQNLKILQQENVLGPDEIPQIRDVNKFLQKKTGFELRPCSGLLSARDFLASLAFRVFQTTTYLRHHKSPHHSPEPDLIHELLGHVPMFSDPLLAQMSQDIGLMSLGASDENIEKLATVYWFIVEFGLCKEDGKLKAIGAGLLSAYGELIHACSDAPQHKDFDPMVTAVQKYEDSDYQPLYFVADSIHDALSKLRKFASSMARPFSVIYDPFTKSIETIKSSEDLEKAFSRLSNDLSAINHAAELYRKMQWTTLILGFLTLFVVYYYKQLYEMARDRIRLYRAMRKFPGPVALPIIGTAFQFKTNIVALTQQLFDWGNYYSKDGSGVIQLWVGPVAMLGVIHPVYAKEILESNEVITKATEYDILFPWLGTGLLTSTGDKWRARRKMLTPAFHFKVLKDFLIVHDYQAKVSLSDRKMCYVKF